MSTVNEFSVIVKELSDAELLDGVHGQLNNSINHLNESIILMYKEKLIITSNLNNENNEKNELNQELQDDLSLYDESILENKKVLKKNFEKLRIANAEIRKRSLKVNSKPETLTLKTLRELCKENCFDFSLLERDEDLVAINSDLQSKDLRLEGPELDPQSGSTSEKLEDGMYI